MPDSGLLEGYLDALERELSFDAALSRRVRKEIEDHLSEATADEPGGDTGQSRRRIIARLGDPREIARQYAASSLSGQIRQLGLVAALALIGIYLAMKSRTVWYGLMQWDASKQVKDCAATWISVDTGAFTLAIALGVAGFAYIASRRAPVLFHQSYRNQVRLCVLLAGATAVMLCACVILDTTFTGLRLSAIKPSAAALVPALSIGLEILLVGLLGLAIRATLRRTAMASALLGNRV